jgi:phosphoribosyl 1,2-cyclic phosphate phosphodiesterase
VSAARPIRVRFLGTGASGGTPGRGRSRRRESSALVQVAGKSLLLDVTRDFPEQAGGIDRLDAALLTHGHRDASGGLPALGRWWRERSRERLPVYAERETIAAVRRRAKRLEHCRFVPVAAGRRRRIGGCTISPLTVPHARERHFPTFAWRIAGDGRTLVYASDVARLTRELERFARGADLLVIDGAMWRRRIFSHLTIDAALPILCGWQVDRIALTQIGKTAPPHEQLGRAVTRTCEKATPAYDGMEIDL